MSEETISSFLEENNISSADVSNQTSNGGSHIDLFYKIFLNKKSINLLKIDIHGTSIGFLVKRISRDS